MWIKYDLLTKLSNIFSKKEDIKDNLTSTDTDKPLSANQGKVLNTAISGKANSSHNQATTTITNDQKYNNIKSGESTTLTLTNQKLINDALNTKLGDLASSITNIQLIEVVSGNLPTSNIKTNRLYFKRNTGSESENLYDIYAYVNNQWEHIDALNIDISEYLKKEDLIASTGLTKTGNGTLSVNYGTSATTSCVGNDSRLSDRRNPLFNQIPNNTTEKSLNTYRTGGFYYCGADQYSKYIDNCPLAKADNYAFWLLVETWGDGTAYIKQTLTYYNTNTTYVRTKKGNADANINWSDWVELSKDTIYTHPNGTAKTGNPTANQSPAFGGNFTVTQFTSNATGHISGATDRTITIPSTEATTSTKGLMTTTQVTDLTNLKNRYDGAYITSSGAQSKPFCRLFHIQSPSSASKSSGFIFEIIDSMGVEYARIYVYLRQNTSTTASSLAVRVLEATDKIDLSGIKIGFRKTYPYTSIDIFRYVNTTKYFRVKIYDDHLRDGTYEQYFPSYTNNIETYDTVENAGKTIYNDSSFVYDEIQSLSYEITGEKFIKKDGTSSQLLLADGTVKATTDFAISGHTHASSDVTGLTASKNVVTNSSGQLITEDKPTIPKVFYGTSATAAGTQIKEITASSDYVLQEGTVLIVKFTNAQSYNASASAPVQLKVNGSNTTVNVAIVGTTLTSRYHWTAGEVVTFVYDGTNFVMEGEGMATTTYYGVTKLSSSTTSTSEALAATPKAVKTAYDLADGKANAEHTHSDSGITYNGGKTNGVTPIDFAASEELSPNRLAFLNPNNITLEYSNDGTANWTSFGDNSSKIKLVTKEEILKAGNNDLNSLDNALSITLDAGGVYNSTDSDIYLQPEKLLIYFNDGGSTGCYCDVSISTYSNPNTFVHKYTYQMEGNYGWNSIPLDIGLWGGFKDQITGSRVKKIRLEFTTQEAYNFKVSKIRMYGANSYIPQRNVNSMAAIGHMYDYDEYGNVVFPGVVNAHSFAMPRIAQGDERILLADGSLLNTNHYMESIPETDVLYNTDISSSFTRSADIVDTNCTYIIFRKMGNMVVATFRFLGGSVGSSYIDVLANGITIPEKYLPPLTSTNLGPLSVNIAAFSGDPARTVTTVIDSSNGSIKVRTNGNSAMGLNTWFTMIWFTDNALANMFGA